VQNLTSYQKSKSWILQDTINTNPAYGMPTTLGSYAFENSRPKENANVVKKVCDRVWLYDS
jgi:hypothetical protein